MTWVNCKYPDSNSAGIKSAASHPGGTLPKNPTDAAGFRLPKNIPAAAHNAPSTSPKNWAGMVKSRKKANNAGNHIIIASPRQSPSHRRINPQRCRNRPSAAATPHKRNPRSSKTPPMYASVIPKIQSLRFFLLSYQFFSRKTRRKSAHLHDKIRSVGQSPFPDNTFVL